MTSTIRAAAQAAVFVGLFVGESSVRGHGPEAVQTAVKEVIRNDALPTEVTHAQIYASPDGETHFRDVKVPLTSEVGAQAVEPFAQSELQAATTIRHVVFPAGWGVSDRDHSVFHNPTSARFVTVRRESGGSGPAMARRVAFRLATSSKFSMLLHREDTSCGLARSRWWCF